MIAGGIGITPLRAMLETLSGRPGDITLLYRTATDNDISFGSELESLAKRRRIQLHLLVGSDIGDDRTDQLGIPALRTLVPDIALRDVYLCGPPPMLTALRRRLKILGVAKHQIHFERFDY
jgi:ferredoxin-NADP reductase